MHRFYVDGCSDADKSIRITGEDVNHILNVLRLGIGDEITISDNGSRDYTCRISSYEPDSFVEAYIVDINDCNAELPADIYLFQGYPKGDKFELIIQKCVELGVYSVIPVMMDRTIVKLDDKKKLKKIDRFNAISESAAKQSRRGYIPKVMDVMNMSDAISFAECHMDVILFPYELAEGIDESRQIINDLVESIKNSEAHKSSDNSISKPSIGIFIGPEGGFSDKEAENLVSAGAKTITLGHRILRTETAGLMIMSVLSFLLD